MYQVLIAEDETPIAKCLAKIISKISNDFNIVKIVNNGELAINYLSENNVDIALLDISMPKKNGIEVLKFIRTNHIKTVCVVISGFTNFDYVKEAMKLGSFDYISKPFDTEVIKDLLGRLDNSIKISNNLVQISDTVNRLTINPDFFIEGNIIASVQINSSSIEFMEDCQLEKCNSYAQVFAEYLKEYFKGEEYYLLNQDNNSVYMIVFKDENNNIKFQKLKDITEQLNRKAIAITICVKSTKSNLSDMKKDYKRIKKLCEERSCYGKSQLFIVGNLSNELSADNKNQVEFRSKIHNSIGSISNYKSLNELLRTVEKLLIDTNGNRRQIEEILKNVIVKLDTERKTYMSYIDIEEDVYDILINSESLNEIMNRLKILFEEILQVNGENIKDKAQLAEKMKIYLENNYDKPFSNQMLSEIFGYVPIYLRKIFKNSYEISPSEFIIQYRIEKAEELLKSGKKSKEVSMLVGFKDPLYFSKVFKKVTGKAPSKYTETTK